MALKEYRKKTTIKAEQFDDSDAMVRKYNLVKLDPYPGSAMMPTWEGPVVVNEGDWIATDDDGEHWCIADSVFRRTYEEVK